MTTAPAHLAPEHQRLYLLMNDPSADLEECMKAARSLAPIMHKPLPPRVLTPEEARKHREYCDLYTPIALPIGLRSH